MPYRPKLNARSQTARLIAIKSVNDVIIDHTLVLAIKRGDLTII